jgi:hypothetical protein
VLSRMSARALTIVSPMQRNQHVLSAQDMIPSLAAKVEDCEAERKRPTALSRCCKYDYDQNCVSYLSSHVAFLVTSARTASPSTTAPVLKGFRLVLCLQESRSMLSYTKEAESDNCNCTNCAANWAAST